MAIVEENFPEHLKEPILRHLQFSTVPRIDQLVDDVYTTFKNDYYPGETVMIRLNDYKNDFKTKCVIREKAKFNAVVDANNNYRPAYCQYRVSRVDNGLEVVVDENQITRDRNNFTKWFVKTFIKLSVSRSPKIGAPWIVKSKYATRYRIPTELPPELAHFKEKPPAPPKKRAPQMIRPKGEAGGKNDSKRFINIAAAGPGSKLKNILPAPTKGKQIINTKTASPPPPKRVIAEDLSQPFDSLTKKPKPHRLEELDGCVQQALESWAFLNVYRVPLILDTFTFDDFLTAMVWDDTDSCGLLDEIFCAVLSGFMSEKNQDLLVPLPEEFDLSDIEDEEEAQVKKEDGSSNGEHKDESNGDEVKKEDDKSEVKEEEEDDDEEDDFEDALEEHHNVEKFLEYRGVSWQERLQKRNFKDGGYQIILCGILDLLRDNKEYQSHINEVFEQIAPLENPATPNWLRNSFMTNVTGKLRITTLNILCSLLVNSPLIRQYLDKCMSESTDLRRERLEKLREYKTAFEKAQNTDKELRELVGNPSFNSSNDQQQAETETKKRRRRTGISKEPSEQELAIAKSNPQYATLLASRTAQLRISEDLRIQRRDLEKKILELDVQRIRYLGKDRLFNRYWWFENNGLPNLGGAGKSSAGDEDNEGGDDLDEEDEDDDDEEFLNETYLMGRLWVQGPTEEDAFMKFGLTEEKIKSWSNVFSDEKNQDEEKEEDTETKKSEVKDENETQDEINVDGKLPKNFVEGAEKIFQIFFDQENKVVRSSTENRTLVDEYGAAAENLTPVQRKIIEENPDPLLTTKHWRYYDKAKEIEDLVNWLNPWGERETKLLKELNTVKDQIISSVQSRRKALKLDSKSEKEEELTRKIEDIIISDSDESSSSSSSSEEEDSDIELLSESESAEPELLSEEEQKPKTRRSIAAAEKQLEEKRRKDAEIRQKIAERKAKRERSRPGRRIAKREEKKRKLKAHEEKKKRKADLINQLEEVKDMADINRCMEWINSSAKEQLGHSHYEGPKKAPPPRAKRGSRR